MKQKSDRELIDELIDELKELEESVAHVDGRATLAVDLAQEAKAKATLAASVVNGAKDTAEKAGARYYMPEMRFNFNQFSCPEDRRATWRTLEDRRATWRTLEDMKHRFEDVVRREMVRQTYDILTGVKAPPVSPPVMVMVKPAGDEKLKAHIMQAVEPWYQSKGYYAGVIVNYLGKLYERATCAPGKDARAPNTASNMWKPVDIVVSRA